MEKLSPDKYVIGILRIALGFYMFWAGIDKIFGFGLATKKDAAIINGGKATLGFLKFGTATSPLHGFYAAIAGNVITEILFVGGLVLIGLALMLGVGTRIAGISGAILMSLMYLAVLPMTHNPLLDEHIIYGLSFLYFATMPKVGNYLGFGAKWGEITNNNPVLA